MLYPVSDVVTINEGNSGKMEELLGTLLSRKPIAGFKNPFGHEKLHNEGLQEQKLFENGSEEKIPEIVLKNVKWLVENGIEVKVHRKLLTPNCHEAIEARKIALNDPSISYSDEIKTLVFDAFGKHRSNGVVKVAFHLIGDGRVPAGDTGAEIKDFLSQEQDKKGNRFNFKEVRFSDGALHGRQDPISFFNSFQDGVQIFDKNFYNKKVTMYTNLGMNTWGVSYEGNLLDVINSLSKVTNTYKYDRSIKPEIPDNNISSVQTTDNCKPQPQITK